MSFPLVPEELGSVAPGAFTETNVVDAGSTSSTVTLEARTPAEFLTRKV